MLRRLYKRLLELAERKQAVYWLAGVSFAESSFFPIPPDVMLIPMVLAQRHRAWFLAGVCAAASVLGGLMGYAIGLFLLNTIGGWIISAYGLESGYQEFEAQFAKWGLWIILAKGLTPIPYKVVAIACGAAKFPLFVFIWASVLTRSIRFFMVAALLRSYGAPIRAFIERHLVWVTTGMVVFVVGGLLLVRLF
jgi:membrane protein YqaA with SNARE-associated domain